MNEHMTHLVIGGLLHDIGKVIYRADRGGDHSYLGHEFVKNNFLNLSNDDILEQILYHHANRLKNAKINADSLAYITYIADNIASGIDRRKDEGETDGGFDAEAELQSVFNIINQNKENDSYAGKTLEDEKFINFPRKESKNFTSEEYRKIKDNLLKSLSFIKDSKEYINSILEILEANCTFVPSSTDRSQICDISLYDHCKMTAAIGSCIYEFLTENNIVDFYDELFTKSKDFYEKKAFIMHSLDISGIQDFIYTIASSGALKGLRARSFYLEVIMEHLIDELLDKLELSRANLIYSGGGHAYIILGNTKKTKDVLDEYIKNTNKWFLENFKTALYLASDYVECSANELGMGDDKKAYRNIFRSLSEKLGAKKIHRYDINDIRYLNNCKHEDGTRECPICKRSDMLITDDNGNVKCSICAALEKMSNAIISHDYLFLVTRSGSNTDLILPNGFYLRSAREKDIDNKNDDVVRIYSKNKWIQGHKLATKLWVGDYVANNNVTFGDLAKEAVGIERLGILRCDVDNLGQAFVNGFDDKNVSLSRTATFSRKLSIFFKKHINAILEAPNFTLTYKKEKRNVVIVYSGGDDIFVVGAWDDVLESAVDLYDSFEKFAQGQLKISGGIGIYNANYPISAMARESGDLESNSKSQDGKDSITLFNNDFAFKWSTLKSKVIEEKYKFIKDFFDDPSNERGKNYIYNLLDYIRNIKNDIINLARYAYILARMEPDKEAKEEDKVKYAKFKEKMYDWIKDKNDTESRKELEMAIILYIYTKREKESEKNGKIDRQ